MVSIIAGVILLPVLYSGLMLWCRADFEQQENREKKPLHTPAEIGILLVSEAALIRIWFALGQTGFLELTFSLLYVMLVGMTVFCVTDLWERRVPNRILLVLLLLFFVILGIYALADMDAVIQQLPAVVLGLAFCAICFGLGYLLSRKSMGAGDVKLALVMGLFLTGEYVVGAVLYGCLISAGYSIVQILRKKLSGKDAIPFVPFLYIGVIIRYFIG